ncbi:hypothetical protein ACH79_40600 [Bradyrhizobium sp. CCBAU 051011]|nr:hypothetical protein ACH79_40600 [Bradyrhizobium sp. CCBAU 051011]
MVQRMSTEFDKIKVIADRKARQFRQLTSTEMELIVEDYTDEQVPPRSHSRERIGRPAMVLARHKTALRKQNEQHALFTWR